MRQVELVRHDNALSNAGSGAEVVHAMGYHHRVNTSQSTPPGGAFEVSAHSLAMAFAQRPTSQLPFRSHRLQFNLKLHGSHHVSLPDF